jgi:phosphate transport system substrate-binding protein
MTRRRIALCLAAATGIGAITVAMPSDAADTFRITGTGGALPLMRIFAEPLLGEGLAIDIVDPISLSGDLDALVAGELDLVITPRPLTAEEVRAGLAVVPFARTPFVFVTSRLAPPAMTSRDIAAAYADADPHWPDGAPLSPILRSTEDFDHCLLVRLVPGMDVATILARKRPNVPVAASPQDGADLAERLPGSLVQAGFGEIIAGRRALQFVPLDGVMPGLDAAEEGRYPHMKMLYFVYPSAQAARPERLLSYLRSTAGRTLLRNSGYLPIH